MASDTIIIVTAHEEADRLPDTLAALASAFPGAHVVVADDGSTDATSQVAAAVGAHVVRSERSIGKGGAATLAARTVLSRALEPDPPVFLLCDGDLAGSAARLPALADAVREGRCDLAVAVFSARVGGGFGFAVGYAHRAIRSLTGLDMRAPISGQRALSGAAFATVVPFAPRFGMEIGMTVDAARAGFVIEEVPLDLAHRATRRTLRGFAHRGRQLVDFVAVHLSRR
ncbi:MAG TPA: glycosyltransferase [Solirubrobacteraceae bacterium]|jgi:glycosyltransferase involved in cell wall biosynthesis|nr:glycosyltransferase [Solirubrobacteraceae bacterium]